MIRISLAAASALMLASCGEAPAPTAREPGAQQGPYAGLDTAIRDWRTEIVAKDTACAGQEKGRRCQGFTVACKGDRPVGPEDRAQGVSTRVVAAMSWEAWDAKTSEYRPAIGFAEFARSGETWSRSEGPRVNLESCATL